MRRKFFNSIAVLCTGLALLVAIFWVRSHWVVDKAVYWPRVSPRSSSTYLLSCEPGRLSIALQFYKFPSEKRDQFIATKREQHRIEEGFSWKSTPLDQMRPEVAAAYRSGFTIASEHFQPYPIEWDKGRLPNAWRVQGIEFRWWVMAVPHWFITVALLTFPVLLIVGRRWRNARHSKPRGFIIGRRCARRVTKCTMRNPASLKS